MTGRERRGPEAPAPVDVLVAINPVARRYPAADMKAALEAAFQRRGLRYRFFETSAGDDAPRLVEREIARALERGCTRVVAAGGDGTVAMVAQALARKSKDKDAPALAIVPAGTANVLAGELGIPAALADAVELASNGDLTLPIDAIGAGDRLMFTQVGVGPDALMIRDTSRAAQTKHGRLAYILSFTRRALGFGTQRFTLEIDGRTISVRALQVVVANVGALGIPQFTWGPGIDPTDGKLDLCVYRIRRIWDYAAVVWRVISGRHQHDSRSTFYDVRERVTIRTRRPMLVQGDGEIVGRTPITLEVRPATVNVLVKKSVESTETPSEGAAPVAPVNDVAPGNIAEMPIAASGAEESVVEDVRLMVAERSRTWALQGLLRHPIAAGSALDAAIFLKVNKLVLGPTFDRLLTWISRWMHYGEGWAVIAAIMLVTDFRAGLRATLEALVVLWATMLTVNFPLKSLFRRRRPFIEFVDARVIGHRPLDFSFPSGHTAAAFAGALLFGVHAPGWSPIFYGLALIVGFSRVYLGVHYPSDVLIGAMCGSLLALAYRTLLHLLFPTFP